MKPTLSIASPRSSGDVVMKKKLKVVINRRNRRVNATAFAKGPVKKFTTKIKAERNTPALRD
jgi:hypothetical protein